MIQCLNIYALINHHLFISYKDGKKVLSGEFPGLEELATVCVMCNDSSVDYNDVSFLPYSLKMNFSTY